MDNSKNKYVVTVYSKDFELKPVILNILYDNNIKISRIRTFNNINKHSVAYKRWEIYIRSLGENGKEKITKLLKKYVRRKSNETENKASMS